MKRRFMAALDLAAAAKNGTLMTRTKNFVLLVAVGLVSDTPTTGMGRRELVARVGATVAAVRLPRCPKAQRNRAVEDEQHRVKRAHGRSLGRLLTKGGWSVIARVRRSYRQRGGGGGDASAITRARQAEITSGAGPEHGPL